MERGARHRLLLGEQLEIFERAVFVVAVFPPDTVSWWDRTVRGFPHSLMQKFPGFVVRAFAVAFCGDFYSEVAVSIRLDRSDWKPVARALAFSELRLAHAAGGPARPPPPFVRWNVAFRKAMRHAS
jgi:hypothetical protein